MSKGKRKQSKEKKQVPELDSNMTLILELSDREFKMTIINTLRALMENVENVKKQVSNVRDMETLRKNQKETLEKTTVEQK